METRLRCAILDDYQGVALEMADWEPVSQRVELVRFDRYLGAGEAVAKELADFEIVVAMRERTVFDEALLKSLPKLKLLITTGMVNASIDTAVAGRQGVTVCGTRSLGGGAAELTWALLMAVMRNIPAETANLRSGGSQWQLSVGQDLQGKVLGVAGLGKLGSKVARYGKAFDMKVMGWSRSNTPEMSAAAGIEFAPSFDALLEASDVVSLHLPLNRATRGILGPREFGLMKEGSVLINTSRGPLVDEVALIAGLKAGKLYGAGLDVFDQEPLPSDHPFRTLPNVVAMPHLGYVTEGNYRVYFADIVEDIAAWLDGQPLRVLR